MFSPIAWPEALRQRAVELALDDHVVEDVAAVVDRRVAHHRHLPGVADRSRPRRHGSRWGTPAASRRWSWCRGLPRSRRAASSPWRASPARTAKSAGRCRPPRSGRPCRRCRLRRLPARSPRWSCPWRAWCRWSCTMAPPAVIAERDATEAKPGDLVGGIAVAVHDLLGRNAEPLGDHAREHRGVALAGRLHVERQDQAVAARKLQRRAFERRAAGMFEHAGDAEPAQLAALERVLAPLLEAVDVGELQRLVDDRPGTRRSRRWCRPRSCRGSPSPGSGSSCAA